MQEVATARISPRPNDFFAIFFSRETSRRLGFFSESASNRRPHFSHTKISALETGGSIRCRAAKSEFRGPDAVRLK
jgi:hypothetical protein